MQPKLNPRTVLCVWIITELSNNGLATKYHTALQTIDKL